MKNLSVILTAIVSFFISYSVLMGWAQEVVHFAGPLNEMFIFILAFTMGVMCLFGLNWRGLWKWLIS